MSLRGEAYQKLINKGIDRSDAEYATDTLIPMILDAAMDKFDSLNHEHAGTFIEILEELKQ